MKPARAKPKRDGVQIRRDVLSAIRRAWPDGIVEMPLDSEDSYFHEIYPELKRKLCRLDGVALLYERDADGGPQWDGESDRDEDPPDWNENPRSYHLFFLSPGGEEFTYQAESEEPDEDEEDQCRQLSGEGSIGCCAAVSLVAPFALVNFGMMEEFEGGSRTDPLIELDMFSLEGERVDPDDYFREILDQQAMGSLERLRGRIAGILESHGLTVLPKEELKKTVPFLRGGEETLLAHEPLTAQDAFFFEGI